MKLLLDTNVVIWLLQGNKRLKPEFHTIIQSNADHVYFSFLNLYEIAMLQAKGRLKDLPKPSIVSNSLILSNLQQLALNVLILDEYHALPMHHKDPFDRLLIAQAIHEDCTIMTSDSWFTHYDVNVIEV